MGFLWSTPSESVINSNYNRFHTGPGVNRFAVEVFLCAEYRRYTSFMLCFPICLLMISYKTKFTFFFGQEASEEEESIQHITTKAYVGHQLNIDIFLFIFSLPTLICSAVSWAAGLSSLSLSIHLGSTTSFKISSLRVNYMKNGLFCYHCCVRTK